MKERPGPTALRTEKLPLQYLPPPLVTNVVCYFMAKDLKPEERTLLKELVTRVMHGKPVCASQEIPQVFESQRSRIKCIGEENIPESGATIIIANHTRGGPFYDMGQYFITAQIVYNARIGVANESIREPYVVMQEGLNPFVRVGELNIPIPLAGPLSRQFYKIVASSTRWELVSPPKFNRRGQITEDQKLRISTIRRLLAGGAMILYPQGKHRTDLKFPEKAGELLTNFKDRSIQLVPLRVIPKEKETLYLLFGKSVYIHNLPLIDGRIKINQFVQTHIAPLGKNLTS